MFNKKLKQEKEQYRLFLSEILQNISDYMYKNFKNNFIQNEPGSGDCEYSFTKGCVEFNCFSEKHKGFFVNDKKVSLSEFINYVQINK